MTFPSKSQTLRLAALALFLAGASGAQAQTPSKPFAVVQRIAGPDGGWDFLEVDASARRLYVARTYGVMSLDLATGKLTEKLAEGAGVHGALPLPGSSLVVSSNGKSDNVLLFDGATGKVEATVAVGKSPDALVYEPKSGLVAVFNGKSADVSLLDPKSHAVVATIALDGKPEVAAADGAGLIFLNLEDKAQVAVIDVATRSVKTRYALPDCEAPTGLAYDAQSGLLISACDNHVAKVLDAKTGKDLATLQICDGPDGALLDARRRRAFITCGDGQMSVLAIKDGQVKLVGNVATGPRAKTGAVDETTGKVYLGTAKFAAPEKEGAKPKALPGTFEILVLSDEN